MSLTALKWSMSTSAIASGDCVRLALDSSTSASASQVDTLSRPVLESTRDWATSSGKTRNLRTSSTVGIAMSTRAGLRPTASVISTPRSTSTNSPCIASRFSSSFRIRTLGSDIFTAATIR